MKKIIGIICALSLVFNAFAQDPDYKDLTGGLNTITTAVPFLLISPDSKAGAMGDVGVATNPDANSLHWNPAKLAFVDDDMGFAMSYVPWLRALVPDINLSYLAGYRKLNDNEAIGLELRYFSLGDITFTDQFGGTLGQYKPSEFALGTSYARKLSDNFSLAISGRYIYSNLTGGQAAGGIPTVAGQSIAADIAGYYTQPIRISGKDVDLAIGGNISNIGNKISYTETAVRDFIPINLRLGTALGTEFDDYNKMSIALDINKLLVPTPPVYEDGEIVAGQDPDVSVVSGIFQSFGDAPGGFKEEMREINYSIGTEYWYANQFAIRAGYFFEHDTKGGRKFFTFGSGVKYNVFALDFSYLINASRAINGNNPLANTMRFTLVFDFGALDEMN
ncbi:MAG: type IX secretion system outer membrane channel protein PorV [Flavobacteriales bacterium]|nr:type IX secretion system outer membrane channel protein PorV [Flavobacteriales bacterium]